MDQVCRGCEYFYKACVSLVAPSLNNPIVFFTLFLVQISDHNISPNDVRTAWKVGTEYLTQPMAGKPKLYCTVNMNVKVIFLKRFI